MNFDIDNTVTGRPPHQTARYNTNTNKCFSEEFSPFCARIKTSSMTYIFNPEDLNDFIETDDGYISEKFYMWRYDNGTKTKSDRVKSVMELERNWRAKKQAKFNRINLNFKIYKK